ncbi:MAG: hypothetical protein WCV63_05225 [Negativicutes bacterium]|jgi:hypothetical protein
MRKITVLLLCLALILVSSLAFAATTAQQQAPVAPAATTPTTINNNTIDIFNLSPLWLPTFSGNVDIQAMPSGTMSTFAYVPSQPNGALVSNQLSRQYGLLLNINMDGSVTRNTAYHLNGNGYVNYYQPEITDSAGQFSPTLEGSGYIYNIAPYLGFLNYQAGRMAYAPGAGLLLYSNMDGVQLNADFGQLQFNLYGGNDTSPAMQSVIAGTDPRVAPVWLFQSADSNPFPSGVPPYVPASITGLGARVVAIDATYSFNNPFTVKAGFADVFAAQSGSGPNPYTNNNANRIQMVDLGVFYDDGTWSGQIRAGFSPSNNNDYYKTVLQDNMCMMGGDVKVQYGKYDISVPGTYSVAGRVSKMGPLAGFSPDTPLIANSGTGYRIYGDYVLDTNFKANVGYTFIQGLQPTTTAQLYSLYQGVKPAYSTSSFANIGLTYYF